MIMGDETTNTFGDTWLLKKKQYQENLSLYKYIYTYTFEFQSY